MDMPNKLKQRLEQLGIPLDIYEKRSRKCIRFLTEDYDKSDLKELGKLEKVPWSSDYFFCETAVPGKSKLFLEGKIAIQDAASVVPVMALEPEPNEDILDACAAPGQKTLLIAETVCQFEQ